MSDDEHKYQLASLVSWASDEFGSILANGALRLGIAQKILNLHLKYLWCVDLIEEPPHCPFDSLVIEKLDGVDIKWTQMDAMEDYDKLVEKARSEAQKRDMSVAEWELREFRG